ncbi:MAG: hypothetical protein LBB23_02730 [Rickettsiales bacterium]|nr:hypothetical protein [Rickettsiales bacterium]
MRDPGVKPRDDLLTTTPSAYASLRRDTPSPAKGTPTIYPRLRGDDNTLGVVSVFPVPRGEFWVDILFPFLLN